MANMYSNTLKIMGNNEEVNEVRNFLVGGPDEAGLGMYINFDKIVKMPNELKIEGANADTQMAQLLLFGKEMFYQVNTLEDAHEAFKKLDFKVQEECTARAFQYQRNLIKYGCENSYEWMGQNWGTMWYTQFHQELIAENEINFTTRRVDAGHIVGIISKKFQEIKFQLEICGEDDAYYKVIFHNGDYTLVEEIVRED